MVKIKDIAWLAGLIEGDGCIGWSGGRCPRIQVDMTDKDVVERAAKIMGTKVLGPYKQNTQLKPIHGCKPMYMAAVQGARAIGVIMTLYSFFGERRKKRALEVITLWKQPVSKYGRKLGKEVVATMREQYAKGEVTIKQLVNKFKANDSTIRRAIKGKTYSPLGMSAAR